MSGPNGERIGYIKLSEFNAQCKRKVKEAVEDGKTLPAELRGVATAEACAALVCVKNHVPWTATSGPLRSRKRRLISCCPVAPCLACHLWSTYSF